MYRLVFCLLLGVVFINVADAINCRAQQRRAEVKFRQLTHAVKLPDEAISKVCTHFTQFQGKEYFGSNSFRLEIYLPEYASATLLVMAMHRVVYISAHVPRTQGCDLTYGDIRILPSIVSARNGIYTYKDQHFIIAFPYRDTINDHYFNAYESIDTTMSTLRRGSPDDRLFSA